MNHLLISDIAQIEIAERMHAADRERLARRATVARRGESRLAAALQGVRAAFFAWRVRTQLGAVSVPLATDPCSDAQGC